MPLLGVGDRLVKAPLRAAERTGADIEPTAIEPRHRDPEPLALAADEVGDGHAAVLEDDLRGRRCVPAQLLLGRAERQAGRVLLDDDGADPAALFLAGADHHDIDVVVARARDELLGTVEDEVVAVASRGRLQRRHVGSRSRLSQAVAADLVHRDEVGEEPRLDLRAAEPVDHPRGHVVDRDKCGCGGTAIGHRLHDERRLQAAERDPARHFADVDRAEPQLARRLPHVDGVMMLLVPLAGERSDAIGGEPAREVLDLALIVTEVELTDHV